MARWPRWRAALENKMEELKRSTGMQCVWCCAPAGTAHDPKCKELTSPTKEVSLPNGTAPMRAIGLVVTVNRDGLRNTVQPICADGVILADLLPEGTQLYAIEPNTAPIQSAELDDDAAARDAEIKRVEAQHLGSVFYRDDQFDTLSNNWAGAIIAKERGAAKQKQVCDAFDAMCSYLDARFSAALAAPAPAQQASSEPDMGNAYIEWLQSRGPLGPGAVSERIFFAGYSRGQRATQEQAKPTDLQVVPKVLTQTMDEAIDSAKRHFTSNQHMWDCALAAAPTPPAARGLTDAWQPIETAPKNGRTVLLGYFNNMGNWRTMRGQWYSQAAIDDEWEEPEGFEAGWYETAVEPDVPNCWSTAPTHWHPLPTQPLFGLFGEYIESEA